MEYLKQYIIIDNTGWLILISQIISLSYSEQILWISIIHKTIKTII